MIFIHLDIVWQSGAQNSELPEIPCKVCRISTAQQPTYTVRILGTGPSDPQRQLLPCKPTTPSNIELRTWLDLSLCCVTEPHNNLQLQPTKALSISLSLGPYRARHVRNKQQRDATLPLPKGINSTMPRTSSFLVRRPRLPLSAFLFTPSLYSFRPTHLSRPAACVAGTQRRVGPSCLAGGGHSRSRSTLQEYVSLKTSGSDLEVLRMDKLLDVCVLSVLDVWLLFAARVGDAETVVALVGEGADVNVQDSEGSTPLMRCISRGHADVAEVLLDAPGIDLLLRNGKSVSAVAARRRRSQGSNDMFGFGLLTFLATFNCART